LGAGRRSRETDCATPSTHGCSFCACPRWSGARCAPAARRPGCAVRAGRRHVHSPSSQVRCAQAGRAWQDVAFVGPNDEGVAAGCDSGHLCVWNRHTGGPPGLHGYRAVHRARAVVAYGISHIRLNSSRAASRKSSAERGRAAGSCATSGSSAACLLWRGGAARLL